jgi:subtilisin family serine protease
MRSYVVLRDLAQPFRRGGFRSANPFEARSATAAPSAPPQPRVDAARLTPKEVRELAQDPDVQAVAPVIPTQLIRPLEVDVAAAAQQAWGIAAVGAAESTYSGSGVVVAVLDTGIDRGHPAFAGATLVERDFSGSGDGDRQGHGTHCAGTIFGRDVAGARIGIARGVQKALIGKVLSDDGGGDSRMIFQGLQWALEEGADVISMSLGFDFPGAVRRMVEQGWPADLATSVALEGYRGNLRMFDAIMNMARARMAFDAGAVIVAAAGNESRRDQNATYEISVSIPAAAEGVVSVGALAEGQGGYSVAPFSNTLPQVSAPGVNILSATPGGGVRAMSGTSMACPHVAGVAALWWEALRAAPIRANATAVAAKLLSSARATVFAQNVDAADRGLGLITAP